MESVSADFEFEYRVKKGKVDESIVDVVIWPSILNWSW